jgi:hypothetical protein
MKAPPPPGNKHRFSAKNSSEVNVFGLLKLPRKVLSRIQEFLMLLKVVLISYRVYRVVRLVIELLEKVPSIAAWIFQLVRWFKILFDALNNLL